MLPVGAYTGTRLAAWISSNYASATYVESTNEIGVAYDGNRRILNDYEIRSLFPGTGSYPAGATPSRPLSINHLLGPSFLDGALQIFTFVTMNPYSELLLRCSTLATAADIKGPLGQDIICKMIIDKGVGNIMQTRTDEGHFVKLHGPITLRTLRFKLTDVDGKPPVASEPDPPAAEPAEPESEPAPAAVPAPVADPPAPAEPAPKRRGRPPGSKNKPKPPKTVPAEEAVPAPAPEPAQPAKAASPPAEPPRAQPEASQPPAEPVRMTPAQERALRYMQRQDRYMELLARNTHEL